MFQDRRSYVYDDVYKSTLVYFRGDALATNVWITKYCLKGLNDNNEVVYYEKTPEDMFSRLAGEFFRAGLKYENPLSYDEIYSLIKDFKYIVPQGRPMAGIGNNNESYVSISNCFVVGHPEEDSYGAICRTDQELIQIFKRGGGCIWENTKVMTKDKGIVPIKDVNVGDYVYSFNINTKKDEWKRVRDKYPADVKLDEQIDIVYCNGTRLKTSKKHPILSCSKDGYSYQTYNDGGLENTMNKTINQYLFDEEENWVKVSEIIEDIGEKRNYIDIEVEDNNNYYAGEFGLVNIHNCGTDISHYRPSGSKVKNAAMSSTGPVDICAKRFSNSAREVGQDGRRAALMISMDITHPDAERFIDAKMNDTEITGANISIKMYDEWLKKALGDGCEIDKENERIWKKIIHNNTLKAEPGILFWDTIIRESVPDCYKDFGFKTISCNPCAELTLCDSDSCRLMLLNLYSYVVNPYTKEAYFDFDLLANHARKITKMMDNMIDLELEKIDGIISKVESDSESDGTKAIEVNLWKRIKNKCEIGRRSGIGVTAVADMIAALGLTYGTEEANKFSQKVQQVLALNVYIESCDLVQRDHRPAFGVFDWNSEKNNPFLIRLSTGHSEYANEFKRKWSKGRRNIALLTIAPAGSVSIMTQTTSGIDPLFLPAYKRNRKLEKNGNIKPDFIDKVGDWYQTYLVIHPKLIEWYSIHNNISFEDANEQLSRMDLQTFNAIFNESPYYKATTADTDWVEKVKMQGMIQKYVDHSISTTVNLPKGTSEDVVRKVYETAWVSGCKGCTIYVDGSRDGILNSISNDGGKKENAKLENNAPKRPKSLNAKIIRFNNNYEKWVAVVGFLNDEPYEIFTGLLDKLDIPNYVESGNIVKVKEDVSRVNPDNDQIETVSVSRYDLVYKDNNNNEVVVEGLSRTFRPEYWNYAKLISGLMRHGMPLPYIIKSISSLNLDDEHLNTWKNGVIRCLRKLMKDSEETGEVCPNCGGKIVRESGCYICKDCGYSKCG